MSTLRTVIAATDFSFSAHRAARRAARLAQSHGAALHLLHVMASSSAKALLRGAQGAEIDRRLHLEAERALDSLAEDVAADGLLVNRSVRQGGVIDEVLAATEGGDLLVLGPRGINPVRDFILGSTAERMARMINCPMLVAKQEPEVTYEHVLLPVDFSPYSAAAVRFAAELAPHAALHVFHALDCSLAGVMRTAGVTDAGISAYCGELEREANENMRELTAALKGRTVFETVQAGDPRALIRQQAASGNCTLIVMGKQGRSWLSEHVLGSVTRLVLEQASCDVVVVPNGL